MSQTLYIKNGSTKTAINPTTNASSVTIKNASGSDSNVDSEISTLRTKVTTLENKTVPTITAGTGITVNTSGDTTTISETYVDVCKVTSLDNVPQNLRDGGLIILETT